MVTGGQVCLSAAKSPCGKNCAVGTASATGIGVRCRAVAVADVFVKTDIRSKLAYMANPTDCAFKDALELYRKHFTAIDLISDAYALLCKGRTEERIGGTD